MHIWWINSVVDFVFAVFGLNPSVTGCNLSFGVRYKERCKLLIATKERRIELAASVRNQKIKANWELTKQSKWSQTEIVDNEIKRQKYYNEYDNKYTAAREEEKADYVAEIATMIANVWTPNDDSNREAEAKTFIDAICNIKDNSGEGKDIVHALLRPWQIKQSVEKQQSKKEIQKHRDKRQNSSDMEYTANRNTIP